MDHLQILNFDPEEKKNRKRQKGLKFVNLVSVDAERRAESQKHNLCPFQGEKGPSLNQSHRSPHPS